jgi:hypothetical protein
MLVDARGFLDRMKGTIPEQATAADLETLNEGLRFFFSKLRVASRLFRQSGDDHRYAAIVDPQGRGRQYLASQLGNLAGTRIAGFVFTRQAPAGKWGAATYALKRTDSSPEP